MQKKWWQADTRWSDWYDSLPQHTKEYLKKQPVWHDSDLFRFMFFGFVIGVLVGIIIAA